MIIVNRPQSDMMRSRVILSPVRWRSKLLGNLEKNVTDVKNAGGRPEHGFVEVQIGHELQLGEPDIEAIDHRHDVANKQEWNKPPRHPPIDVFARALLSSRCDPVRFDT